MKHTTIKILSGAGLLLLSGCAMIPGSHLKGRSFSRQNVVSDQDLRNVNRIVIDSEVIKELRARPAAAETGTPLNGGGYVYRIGVGDILSIGVWDHPELTIPAAVQRTKDFDGFRVQSDGTITYAYAPKLPAAGKTVIELHKDLVEKLSEIIEEPQVDLKVVGFNSQKVYVAGEVKTPGVYPVTGVPLTLMDALNQAGGLNEKTANANGVFVLRRRNPANDGVVVDVYQLHAKNAVALVLASRFELQSQDIVYVTAASVSRWNRLIRQLVPLTAILDDTSSIEARGNIF